MSDPELPAEFKFWCFACDTPLNVPRPRQGSTGKCPTCEELFRLSELGPGERPTVTVELPLGAAASGLNKLTMGTGGGAVAEIPFDGTKTCGYYISPC